jgi:hypothetical protein
MSRSPSAEESAVIAAAIERFQAETSLGPAPEPQTAPWQRAALLEGVGAKATIEDLEQGGARWLS